MSDNFPNISSNGGDMGFEVRDPGNTNAKNQSAGGKTKIRPSADAPHPGENVGYGYQSPELKNVGTAPSGENSSGIPAAQSVDIMTFGDPNNTAVDMDDAGVAG